MREEIITALAQAFARHGKELYLVGGTVRDELLGRESHDIDCATNALPEEIKTIAQETNPLHIVPIGEKFGTIQLQYATDEEPLIVEITTYRGERYTPGSRKPDVQFTTSLYEDLRRRDFTINAIAKNPLTGEIIDPFDGREDLERGIIRSVDDPVQRFRDDPLRLMRAIRFAAQFDFFIAHDTQMAMIEEREQIYRISMERVRDELSKVLVSDYAAWYIDLLHSQCGLLSCILPEVYALIGVEQPPHHKLDVYNHTALVLQGVPARLSVRLAALLHDIGKPATKTMDNKVAHFYGHEDVGAEMARQILRRLKFDNNTVEHVAKVVSMHMRVNRYTSRWSNGAVRRLVVDAGETIDDLLDLAVADGASDRDEPYEVVEARIQELRERIQQVQTQVKEQPIQSPLDGNELMALFGRKPGPWLRDVKRHLCNLVIEGMLQSDDKETAKTFARTFLGEGITGGIIGNRTAEQMMDCIILIGEREWENRKASDVISDILAYFSKAIGQDVQLISIWEDITLDYLRFKYSKVSDALDTIAKYTGSRVLCHGAQVWFLQDRRELPPVLL
jgi:poly(A) polymerase